MSAAGNTPEGTLSRSQLAALAGVERPAITNWERRHVDFPKPVTVDGLEYFRLEDVLAWLAGRTVPTRSRTAEEPSGTTYADRVRRRLRGTGTNGPVAASETRVAENQRLVDKLLGPLGDRVRGSGTRIDYLYLLLCLVFLRTAAPDYWAGMRRAMPSTGSPETARKLLHQIGTVVDATLRHRGHPPGTESPLVRLQPRQFADLVTVISLSDGFAPDAFRLLLDRYQVEFGLRSDEFFTPSSLTRLLIRVLDPDEGALYDPYARGGELLAEATRWVADPSRLSVHGESPHADTLRLAGMSLILHGLSPQLALSETRPWDRRQPPPVKARYVLTNPPFGATGGLALQRRPDDDWAFGPPPPKNENYAWLQYCQESITADGRAAVLMPAGAGWSSTPREREIRHAMIERGAVEAVIALPRHLFAGSGVAVSAWLLKHATGMCEQVLFIDARHLGTPTPGRWTLSEKQTTAIVAAYRSFRDDSESGRRHVGTAGLSIAADLPMIRSYDWSLNPPDYLTRDEPSTPVAASVAERVTAVRHELSRARALASGIEPAIDALAVTPRATTGQHDGFPADWRRVRLHDVCDIQAGPSYSRLSSKKRSNEGAVAVALPRHLRHGRIEAVDVEKVSAKLAGELDRFRLAANDVVCVRSGAMGQPALVTEAQAGWLLSTNLLRLRPSRPDLIDSHYLLAYLTQRTVTQWIKERSAGTVIASLSTESLGQLQIPLPPLVEQHRIVTALATLDAQTSAYRDLAAASEKAQTVVAEHLINGALALPPDLRKEAR